MAFIAVTFWQMTIAVSFFAGEFIITVVGFSAMIWNSSCHHKGWCTLKTERKEAKEVGEE